MSELSPDAKNLLKAARDAYSPTDHRIAAVRSALAARLDVTHAGGNILDGGAAAVGGWSARRLLGISLVVATFSGGALVIGARETAPAPLALAPVPSSSPQVQPNPPVQPAAGVQFASNAAQLAPALEPRSPEPRLQSAVRSRRGNVSGRGEAHRKSGNSKRGPLGSSASAVNPITADSITRDTTREALAASSESKSTGTTQAVAMDHSNAVPATPGDPQQPLIVDDSLQREIVLLLRRARAALARHDPQTALALADEHAALFPSGRLRQERVAVRVIALCELGRTAQAQAATQELERIAPRSPHLMRIRAACERQSHATTER